MSCRRPSWFFVALGSALLLMGAVLPARAQCPIGDLLDCGPCWGPAQVQLPPFPAFRTSALDICYQNCNNLPPITLLAEWGALRPAQTAVVPPVCSVFVSRLTLKTPAGAVQWGGAIRLWYSRTWIESGAGTRFQVWRFLANGDLKPVAGLGVPCPVPPCAAAFANKVHHWGYLDIAEDCLNGGRFYAWSLTHECDQIDHAPGFPRAGAFHPDRSYTFVGPAGGFVVTPVMPDEGTGPIPVENFRPLNLALLPGSGAVCVFEERANGSINSIQQFCMCPTAPAPPQYNLAVLNATGLCGTVLTTGPVPPYGFVSKGIGNWTNPAKYPGVELLRLNFGLYRYDDPCRPRIQDEHFYGVTTMQGFTAFESTCLSPGGGAPLPLTFIDQGNSRVFPALTPTRNFKFVSDIILNFNK